MFASIGALLYLCLVFSQRPPFPLYGVLARYRVNYTPKRLALDSENPVRSDPATSSVSSTGVYAHVLTLTGIES